jgi:hypothetical protein
VIALGLLLTPATVSGQAVSPANYNCFDATQTTGVGQAFTGTCTAESPFAQILRDAGFEYFHFEDWETFNLNSFINPIPTTVPGVLLTGGGGVTAGDFSPDADDFVVDDISNGTSGLQTVFATSGSPRLTIAFDEVALGGLPTHVAVVVTGVGANSLAVDVTAEFFAEGGASLGTVVRPFNQVGPSDSTDDAFMGWTHAEGIESMTLDVSTNTGINLDHLHYGLIATPGLPVLSPGTQLLLVTLFAVTTWVMVRRRRS